MLILLLALATPSFAQADATEEDGVSKTAVETHHQVLPSALQGTWRRERASEREDAIEKIVDEMPWYERGIARGRLLSVTAPCDRITISEQAGNVRVGCDDRPLAVGAPGERMTWKDEEGKQLGLLFDTDGNVLTQTFTDKDGSRTNTYRVQGDRLVLETSVTSKRLPRPLTYTQHFVR